MAIGLLTALSATFAPARAADQEITGKKLIMNSASSKVVLLSKDPSISIAGANPLGGPYSILTFSDGTDTVQYFLPSSIWSTNASATLFKYKNRFAPGGPSPVKIAKVKNGLLKVVAKDLPFAVPNGPATIRVVLALDGGANSYCMSFTGAGDGSKFVVTDQGPGDCFPTIGPACCEYGNATCGNGTNAIAETCLFDHGEAVGGDAACDGSGQCVSEPSTPEPGDCCQFEYQGLSDCKMPMTAFDCASNGGTSIANAVCNPDGTCSSSDTPTPTPTSTPSATPTPNCTGTVVGGYCWYYDMIGGSSCDAVCAAAGGTCDPAGTANYAGDGGTLPQCEAVLTALTGFTGTLDTPVTAGVGCFMFGGVIPIRGVGTPTTCAAADGAAHRACACN